ncbi:hypothetical protein LZ30DRAFT_767061 [Colletotrichum cereale]|nr:hypothetical protein LZ30DRAFT_767061 [Colletotrichum cereale]
MEGIDPFRVIFIGSVLVAGLMMIFQIGAWLLDHLPKLLAGLMAAGSFEIPIYTLIAALFFHLFVLAPIIRCFVPKATVETEAERPSPANLATELSDEQRAAEARRCRLPGPVCDSMRTQLESKKKEVNKLVWELGQAEQRELDANGAAEAERNSHKSIRRRLDRTEQQLVRYDPEANAIRKLESLLAESEKKVAEAEKRVETGERLLKTEVESSAWIAERKKTQAAKLRCEMAELTRKAKDRISVLSSKVKSLEHELDAATRKGVSADVKASQAQIQTAEAMLYEKEKKIDKLENQLKKAAGESKTALAHANDQVGKLRARLSAAQEKMVPEATKENMEGLKRQLDELGNQARAADVDHNSKMSQASAIHTEQQQCIESLRNDMNTACIENTDMRQEISRLQELLNQHATSDANNSAVEQRIAAMRHQHQTDLNQAQSVLDAKDGEIKHLQNSLAGTQTHIDSLQEEVSEMQGCVDEQDKQVDELEQKLRKALRNERKAIERSTELEDQRKKEATADLLKYNRLRVEYNKATQERDKLLAGNQTDETKRLGDQLAKALDLIVTRDLKISQLREQVASMNKTGNGHAGANTMTARQKSPKTPHQETQIYTPETRRKQHKALEMIERVQMEEGIKDDDAEEAEGAQSDDEMETESTQAHHVPDTETTGGGEDKQKKETADEAFEAAMNEAIDESNREYSERTAAAFTTAIQAPGITNPFAAPGPPATAQDFSAMFGRGGPMVTVGRPTAQPGPSEEKPATPEGATERHLRSGVTFWVPQKKSANASTPQQQQQQQNVDGQEAPDTPAPTAGRKYKKPSARRQRAREQGGQ